MVDRDILNLKEVWRTWTSAYKKIKYLDERQRNN